MGGKFSRIPLFMNDLFMELGEVKVMGGELVWIIIIRTLEQ